MKKDIYFTHHAKKSNNLINSISDNLFHNGLYTKKRNTAASTDKKPSNVNIAVTGQQGIGTAKHTSWIVHKLSELFKA